MTAAIADTDLTFDYTFMPISDLKVETTEDPKTGRKRVEKVIVQDEPLKPTERFWTSLYSRYGFNSAFMKYFEHEEVFDRISKIESNDRMRLCIERDSAGNGTLLGVSNPSKPIVVFDELMGLLNRYNCQDVSYCNGIAESIHTPRIGANKFMIGGDEFINKFMMATPIDGYGGPSIYLSLLRMICSNGVIGYAKTFRSGLSLGKGEDNVGPSLTRALDGFNNEEGYAALRQRMESAVTSWASVYEATCLYRLVTKLYSSNMIDDLGGVTPKGAHNIRQLMYSPSDGKIDGIEGVGSLLLLAFHKMTGDTSKIYGLANLDALSVKRQRTLPVKCTVYDLVNFATEISTHYATPAGARQLQAWVGGIVSEEFDMEGTRDKFDSFADFHLQQATDLDND